MNKYDIVHCVDFNFIQNQHFKCILFVLVWLNREMKEREREREKRFI